MVPTLNFEAILNDPLLLTAAILLLLGPLVFLISMVQFFRAGKKVELPPIPTPEEFHSPVPPPPQKESPVEETVAPPAKEELVPPPYIKEAKEETPPPPPPTRVIPMDPDKTVVMTSGLGEVQGQLEIAFTQIKSMNKKIAQLESELETVSKTASARLENHELNQSPADPADFTQKLLKLAEHVIVLEKEVARLKSQGKQEATLTDETGEATARPQEQATTGSASPRPPVMPI